MGGIGNTPAISGAAATAAIATSIANATPGIMTRIDTATGANSGFVAE